MGYDRDRDKTTRQVMSKILVIIDRYIIGISMVNQKVLKMQEN
jgi:hypothetical protein